MSGKAARILLTETMFVALRELSNRTTLASRIATRVNVILLGYEKLNNVDIGRAVGLGRKQVGLWRRRWRDSYEALLAIQLQEPRAVLIRSIIEVLTDAARAGSVGKFTAEQVVQIIATACESPRSAERPVETWTGRELADEVQKRGLVASISTAHVNRILARAELQPHRCKYWCFTTEKDKQLFQSQVEAVCQTYLQSHDRFDFQNTRTVCVDEMTSLQANERRAETKRACPGQLAKVECQYSRHGTLSLTGSWDVVTGQMISTTIAETRDSEDFATHIERTIRTDLQASWIFVIDNLNTHCGEPLVRRVAKLLGIDQKDLGDKKKRIGILGSMASRRRFLSDPTHAIRFVYIPKHSSWMNQIEVVFGIISKRVMRSGNFHSPTDLREKLLAFVDYFNRTFAKPMRWTYTGKPLHGETQPARKTWRETSKVARATKTLALVA
ncbi:MAG: transposase [Rubripirellula sp.]